MWLWHSIPAACLRCTLLDTKRYNLALVSTMFCNTETLRFLLLQKVRHFNCSYMLR